MEWSKTKTILIIALLITNLIIGYFVLQEYWTSSRGDYHELESDMVAILKTNHIDVSQLPNESKGEMPSLYAAYIPYKLNVLADELLQKDYKQSADTFQDSDYELLLKDPYTLSLVWRRPVQLMSNGDGEQSSKDKEIEADKLVSTWVMNHFGIEKDFQLANTVYTEDGILLNYTQLYDTFFIDGSYMSALVNGDRIIRFERKWFNFEVRSASSIKIAPYAVALYRLMDEVYAVHSTVKFIEMTEVSLGYRLEGSAFNTDIQAGEISPYFKFKATNGQTYMVEALWAE